MPDRLVAWQGRALRRTVRSRLKTPGPRVVDKYEALSGLTPSRIVIHKTSMYQPEEELGFRSIANSRVPACELVWIRPTALRLVRKGMQEPWRGTLCTIGDEYFLFTMG